MMRTLRQARWTYSLPCWKRDSKVLNREGIPLTGDTVYLPRNRRYARYEVTRSRLAGRTGLTRLTVQVSIA